MTCPGPHGCSVAEPGFKFPSVPAQFFFFNFFKFPAGSTGGWLSGLQLGVSEVLAVSMGSRSWDFICVVFWWAVSLILASSRTPGSRSLPLPAPKCLSCLPVWGASAVSLCGPAPLSFSLCCHPCYWHSFSFLFHLFYFSFIVFWSSDDISS